MSRLQQALLTAVVGISALVAFAVFTNIWAAVSLFVVLFANNADRALLRETRDMRLK